MTSPSLHLARVCLAGFLLTGFHQTLESGPGWRIEQGWSPLMEPTAPIALELRPEGQWFWRKASEFVIIWRSFRRGRCVAVEVPSEELPPGHRDYMMSCSGHPLVKVGSSQSRIPSWEDDGVYDLVDDTESLQLTLGHDEMLRRYDALVQAP